MNETLKQLGQNMGIQIVNLNLELVDWQAKYADLNNQLEKVQQENTELKTQLKAIRNKTGK